MADAGIVIASHSKNIAQGVVDLILFILNVVETSQNSAFDGVSILLSDWDI